MHNRSHAAGPDDGPDEEGDGSDGNKVRLDREQMPNLVNGKPDGG